MTRFRTLFAAAAIIWASAAYPINIRAALVANPDGVLSTLYPCTASDRSNCAPPATGTLTCNDSAAPSLSGQTVGSSYSENVRSYLGGSAAATATLGLVTVSGSDAATTGWAVGANNLTISSSTQGTGSLRVTATTGGNTVDCSARTWSRVAVSSDGGVAPTIPTGLTYVAGANSVTISGDAPSDPPPTASLTKQVNLRFNGAGATTAVTVAAGLSRTLTQQIIGSSDGTPSSSQTGTGQSLGFGGTGVDSTADNILAFTDTTGITGDAFAAVTVASVTSAATFPKVGIRVAESNAVGAKAIYCYVQNSTTKKVQCKTRATDGVATTSQLSQTVTGTVSLRLARTAATNNWQFDYSTDGGTNWTPGVAFTLSMASTLYWGTFITSTSAGTNATTSLSNWNLNNIARWSYLKSTVSTVTVDVTSQDNDNNVSSYSGSITAVPNAVAQLRWRPGHYVRMGPSDTAATINGRIVGFCADSAIAGVVVIPYWNLIETSKGVYDWTLLDSVMTQAAACSKSVIIRVQDRAFGTTNALKAIPQYIYDEHLGYARSSPSEARGVKIWDATAMQYLINLQTAILNRYAANTTLAATAGEETSLGSGNYFDPNGLAVWTDYTKETHEAQERVRAVALRAAAPGVPFVLYTNFWSNTAMQDWDAQAALDPGILFTGGPDCHCDASGRSGSSTAFDVGDGTIGGINYKDTYPWFGSTESDDYGRGATPSSIFTVLNGTFHVNFMSWSYTANPPGGTWTDVRAFIDAHPVTHTSCPAGVAQGCN